MEEWCWMRDIGVRLVSDLWIALGVIWLLGAVVGSKAVVRRQTRASRLFEVGTAALGFTLVFNGSLPISLLRLRLFPASVTVAGIVLTVAGMLFALWARMAMRGNWSASVTVKQDHVLLHRGPFAIVRHPIYAGLLLALLGTTLTIGELRCLLGLAIVALAFLWKLRIEEGFMREQFGAEYTHYQGEVNALIPRLFKARS